MKHLTPALALAALAIPLLDLSSATALAAPTRVVPPHAHALSSTKPSTMRDRLGLYGGDAHHLVYAQLQRTALGSATLSGVKGYVLVKQNGKSRTISLGTMPGYTSASPVKVVGNTISTPNSTGSSFQDSSVWLWHLTGKAAASPKKIPLGSENHKNWLATASNGFYYTDGSKTYLWHAGKSSLVPDPFAHQPIRHLAPSAAGLVASTKHQVAFYSSATHHWRRLPTGAPKHSNFYFHCGPASFGHIACSAAQPDPDDQPTVATDVLSLTGAAPTFTHDDFAQGVPVLTKLGTTWTTYDTNANPTALPTFTTLTYAGTTTTRKRFSYPGGIDQDNGNEYVFYAAVPAFGKVIALTNHGDTAVAGEGLKHHFSPVANSHFSSVQVSAFSADGGRVAWRDDSGRNGTNIVHLGDFASGNASHLTSYSLPPHAPNSLAVDADALAYGSSTKSGPDLVIHALAGGTSTTIPDVKDTDTQVAGPNVLYLTGTTASNARVDAHVYNVLTATTYTLPVSLYGRNIDHRDGFYFTASLGGNYLSYEKDDGSVWAQNITSPSTPPFSVAPVDPEEIPGDPDSIDPDIQAYGDYVAWGRNGFDYYIDDVATASPSIDVGIGILLAPSGIEYDAGATGAHWRLSAYGASSPQSPVVLTGSYPLWADSSLLFLSHSELWAAPETFS